MNGDPFQETTWNYDQSLIWLAAKDTGAAWEARDRERFLHPEDRLRLTWPLYLIARYGGDPPRDVGPDLSATLVAAAFKGKYVAWENGAPIERARFEGAELEYAEGSLAARLCSRAGERFAPRFAPGDIGEISKGVPHLEPELLRPHNCNISVEHAWMLGRKWHCERFIEQWGSLPPGVHLPEFDQALVATTLSADLPVTDGPSVIGAKIEAEFPEWVRKLGRRPREPEVEEFLRRRAPNLKDVRGYARGLLKTLGPGQPGRPRGASHGTLPVHN